MIDSVLLYANCALATCFSWAMLMRLDLGIAGAILDLMRPKLPRAAQAPDRTAEPMVSAYRSLPPHPAEVELRELRARLREMGGEE